jgi:hypothetical protein
MASPSLKPQSVIPQEVQGEIVALAFLTNSLHRTLTAIQKRHNSIIEKLTGVKVDDALIARLFDEHNKRVAKSARRRAA